MLKIRRPLGRLIFNMGITIPCKTVFLIETAPRWSKVKTSFTVTSTRNTIFAQNTIVILSTFWLSRQGRRTLIFEYWSPADVLNLEDSESHMFDMKRDQYWSLLLILSRSLGGGKINTSPFLLLIHAQTSTTELCLNRRWKLVHRRVKTSHSFI